MIPVSAELLAEVVGIELWDDTSDTVQKVTLGRDVECRNSTALQNASVHDSVGEEIAAAIVLPFNGTVQKVTFGRDPECSYSTALQKASVHDDAGDEIYEHFSFNITREYSSDQVKRMLLSLPRESQEILLLDVVTAMGSSFLARLQNQQQASVQDMNRLESQHVVDIESINQHMQDSNDNPNERTQQNAERQCGMWRSLLCSVTASALCHIVLYVLVKKLERGENKNLENKRITKTDWMNWLWEKIVAPVCMGLVMCLLRVYVIGAEEKRIAPQYTNNAVANLAINSASKIVYFAIKELPILVADLYLWGHLVSFIIDLLGAFYLWWSRGYHDPDVPDS